MKSALKMLVLVLLCANANNISADNNSRFKEGLKLYLNKDSTNFLKATFVLQNWVRYNSNNPGTTVFGYPEKETIDMGIRRIRLQIFGQVHPRVFVYTQFGMNNFNYIAGRKTGAFFHDAVTEYNAIPKYLTIGTGLTGWAGYSRYSAAGIGSLLAVDAPLFEQATNDLTDQFLRKLSVYNKGKIGKLDYRLAVSKPLPVQTALTAIDTVLKKTATFAPNPSELQYQGYVMYQFFDQESNQLAYMTGTYLGKKRVLNIGAGYLFQKNAMRYLDGNGNKIYHNMQFITADIFYDTPLNKDKGTVITAYAAYFNFDFGNNFIRNLGAMNTATGVNAAQSSFNGAGNAFPIEGTGQVYYAQVGYKLKNDLFKNQGTLQPYAGVQYGMYKALKNPATTIDAGFNWLINGHGSKLSLNYQSRPVFFTQTNGDITESKSARRGLVVVQYQISF